MADVLKYANEEFKKIIKKDKNRGPTSSSCNQKLQHKDKLKRAMKYYYFLVGFRNGIEYEEKVNKQIIEKVIGK